MNMFKQIATKVIQQNEFESQKPFCYQKGGHIMPKLKKLMHKQNKIKANYISNELYQDIKDQNIQRLVLKYQVQKYKMSDLYQEKYLQQSLQKENKLKLVQQNQRKWLTQRGKQYLIDFSDQEIKQLKKYFNNIDTDNSGFIGLQELQIPFISLGIMSSVQEIKKIFDQIDKGKNNAIEFDEFLSFIKHLVDSKPHDKASLFFKQLIQGNINKGVHSKQLSFQSIVSFIRRQKFMGLIYFKIDATTGQDQEKKIEGLKVMKSYEKMLLNDQMHLQNN